MANQKKIDEVKSLSEKLRIAQSVVLIDYKGIDGQGDILVRKMINSEKGIEYLITKNRLFKIALRDIKPELNMDSFLKGPSAFIFSYEDATLASRMFKKFNDSNDIFKVKGGIVGDKVMQGAQIEQIASLPSKEILQQHVGRVLKSVITKLQITLKSNLNKLTCVMKNISEKQ